MNFSKEQCLTHWKHARKIQAEVKAGETELEAQILSKVNELRDLFQEHAKTVSGHEGHDLVMGRRDPFQYRPQHFCMTCNKAVSPLITWEGLVCSAEVPDEQEVP